MNLLYDLHGFREKSLNEFSCIYVKAFVAIFKTSAQTHFRGRYPASLFIGSPAARGFLISCSLNSIRRNSKQGENYQ